MRYVDVALTDLSASSISSFQPEVSDTATNAVISPLRAGIDV